METGVKSGPQVTKVYAVFDGYPVTFTLKKLDKLSLSPVGPSAPKILLVPWVSSPVRDLALSHLQT